MTLEEKEDFIEFGKKSSAKLNEIFSLNRDGKFIIADEKLRGLIKIFENFHDRVSGIKPTNE